MRIGFVYSLFYPAIGGAESVVLNLGKELTRRGHEITVLTSMSFSRTDALLRGQELVDDVPRSIEIVVVR